MKTIFLQTVLIILISSTILNAQYDTGTVLYNQTSSSNLTSVSKNYIVEDFDGDFNADVIMVKGNATNNTNHLTWYKGNGSGNFVQQANLMSVENIHRNNEIFYEDMNGDDIKDIVFQNSDTGFKILLNDGQGNISAQINNMTPTDNLDRTDLKEIADIDNDGDMDGIFFEMTNSVDFYTQNSGYCHIGYNNGTGTFSNYNYLELVDYTYAAPYHVEVADIDGDADLDIIYSKIRYPVFSLESLNISVTLYKNMGLNDYTPIVIDLPYGMYNANIKLQDINADDTDELLIEYSYPDNCKDPVHGWGCEEFRQFKVLDYTVQNNAFATLETYDTWLHGYNNAFQIQFGLQNTDNNLDILSVNVPQGKLHWYYGDGNGSFNNGATVNFNNQYSSIQPTLRVVDIDNDTDLDIFVLLNDATSSTLTVFKNLALSPACAPVLDLEDDSLTDGIYQAGTTLISSGEVVSGNNNVVLKAGNNVKLENGFTVPTNSTVKVRIGSCN